MTSWKEAFYRGLDAAIEKTAAPQWVRNLRSAVNRAKPYAKAVGNVAATGANLAFGGFLIKSMVDSVQAAKQERELMEAQKKYYESVKALQNRGAHTKVAAQKEAAQDSELGTPVGISDAEMDPLTRYLLSN